MRRPCTFGSHYSGGTGWCLGFLLGRDNIPHLVLEDQNGGVSIRPFEHLNFTDVKEQEDKVSGENSDESF